VRPGRLTPGPGPRRRTGLDRGTGPRRHKRINSVSDRRAAARDERAEVRAAVFARDGGRCRLEGSLLGPCIGPLTVHHLWKDGQGGPYLPVNLLTLCAGHNDGVEPMDRADAEALGLVVAMGDWLSEAWRRLIFAGVVDHWWDGCAVELGPPADDLQRVHVR
jgi:hypothetical protein